MRGRAVVFALALGACAPALQVVHPETRSEPRWQVLRQPGQPAQAEPIVQPPPQPAPAAEQQAPPAER